MQPRTVRILSIALFLALAAWGTYAFISYVGVPVHQSVLLSDPAKAAVDAACGEDRLLCRGWHGLIPSISFTLERSAPFLWYAIVSVLLYGGFIGYQFLRHQKGRFEVALAPWHLLLLFVGSLWLVFTVLAYGTNGGLPMRRVVEPVASVYPTVGDEALKELRNSYNALKAEGCLNFLGNLSDSNAEVYDLKGTCIQESFVTRVLTQVVFVLLFLFELLVLGRGLLRLLRIKRLTPLLELVFSAGLGACGWIALLWAVSVAASETYPLYTQTVGWLLFAAVPIALYRQSKYWVDRFLFARVSVRGAWHDVTVLLLWLLVSYLALNFLTVVRPFPIGWDDLGSYLNRPRLLVSYGRMIPVMPNFQWEFLTSLGFLLFGFQSYFAATASMLINWSEGLLAVLVVYVFTTTFLGKRTGLLASLLYYSLPLVGHFSFADMKVDNAVFFIGALATLAVFSAFFETADDAPEPEDEHSRRERGLRLLALAGLFTGFAFSIKYTAAMVLLALLIVIIGSLLQWLAFVGSVLCATGVLIMKDAINLRTIVERMFPGHSFPINHAFAAVIFFLAGLACIIPPLLRDRPKARTALVAVGVFVLSFAVALSPWVIRNDYLLGKVGLYFVTPNSIAPTIAYSLDGVGDTGQPIHVLPPALTLDPKSPACVSTSHTEELDRYWGFGKGVGHYLTLPWRTVMNLDSVGYYVTTSPLLLLFPLLLLLPFFWSRKARWVRWLFLYTAFILFEWIFTANGVPWYGVGIFLGLALCLEVLVQRAPDMFGRGIAILFVALSLLNCFAQRVWQFEQQQNILEYPIGKISGAALSARTITHYDDISAVVTDRHASIPDRSLVYRVGTFIPYFIPRNLEVIGVADHQLDIFTCLNQEQNHALTLKRLKALGFNSIIFDTNTATIERDQNGTLHRKVQSFIDFLNDASLGLQVVVNDSHAGVAFVLIP